jgi:3-phosphoshikimate 1-carboxyvinyltransferase
MLRQLGVQVTNFNGHLPISVRGPIRAGNVTVDASYGSQLLSGALFALAFTAAETLTIEVTALSSRPYIDLTLDVLKQFGKTVTHCEYRWFTITPATSAADVELTIEGDWSSAAAFLVAGAIGGTATVTGLSYMSRQADRLLMDVLQYAGVKLSITYDGLTTTQALLNTFDADLTNAPDLFPILAILAACGAGESSLTGLHRLAHKESNRKESVTAMLRAFGVPWRILDDTLLITGLDKLRGSITIDSHQDHRIVMAAAMGALRASGEVTICHSDAVNKSYPAFFKHLSLCGISCTSLD